MSATAAAGDLPSDGMEVNTIALIVGLTVVATVLLIVCLTILVIGCRNCARKRRKDRSRQYMVQNGASPFSSLNGPPSGGIPSYSGVPHVWGSSSSYFVPAGYENKAVDVGEFRPNPLAENPYYPQQQRHYGVSMINPYGGQHHAEYSGDIRHHHNQPYLAQSSQSFSTEAQSLHQTLYAKLTDTVHERDGRPIYLCKREHYNDLFSNYFDIVGKSRSGDLLVKPRANIPNRPKKKSSKKQKAPNMSSSSNHFNHGSYEISNRSNGYIGKPMSGVGGSVITTPFGAAERIPSHYLSGSHTDRTNNNVFEQQPYTSLPRDGKLRETNPNSHMVRRQASTGAADREAGRLRKKELDEQMYAQVMKKNALNGVPNSGPDRQVLHRRPISTIEEVPTVPAKTADALNLPEGGHRERSGSASTSKSLGFSITDQFKFLEQYDTEEERF